MTSSVRPTTDTIPTERARTTPLAARAETGAWWARLTRLGPTDTDCRQAHASQNVRRSHFPPRPLGHQLAAGDEHRDRRTGTNPSHDVRQRCRRSAEGDHIGDQQEHFAGSHRLVPKSPRTALTPITRAVRPIVTRRHCGAGQVGRQGTTTPRPARRKPSASPAAPGQPRSGVRAGRGGGHAAGGAGGGGGGPTPAGHASRARRHPQRGIAAIGAELEQPAHPYRAHRSGFLADGPWAGRAGWCDGTLLISCVCWGSAHGRCPRFVQGGGREVETPPGEARYRGAGSDLGITCRWSYRVRDCARAPSRPSPMP